MKSEQLAYLMDEVFSLTLMGTMSRGRLYRKGSTEAQRKSFRHALRSVLERLAEKYKRGMSEAQHVANIDKLANTLSETHPEALAGKRFRIGSAQKALNLYLKYLWCLGRIPTPPHCPFDSIVLSRVPGCRTVRFTQLDSLSEYRRIVQCAKAAAGRIPIADWELRLYNAAQPRVRLGS